MADLPANAVMAMHRLQGCCVWIDPQAPPEQRYKSQAKCGPHPDRPHTLEFFASPDGLEWEHLHGIRIEDCDTQNVVFWDESYGRYVMYTRLWVRDDDPNRNHRKVRRLESDDLVHWDSESVVWEADAADLATYRTSPACRRSTTTGRPSPSTRRRTTCTSAWRKRSGTSRTARSPSAGASRPIRRR